MVPVNPHRSPKGLKENPVFKVLKDPSDESSSVVENEESTRIAEAFRGFDWFASKDLRDWNWWNRSLKKSQRSWTYPREPKRIPTQLDETQRSRKDPSQSRRGSRKLFKELEQTLKFPENPKDPVKILANHGEYLEDFSKNWNGSWKSQRIPTILLRSKRLFKEPKKEPKNLQESHRSYKDPKDFKESK